MQDSYFIDIYSRSVDLIQSTRRLVPPGTDDPLDSLTPVGAENETILEGYRESKDVEEAGEGIRASSSPQPASRRNSSCYSGSVRGGGRRSSQDKPLQRRMSAFAGRLVNEAETVEPEKDLKLQEDLSHIFFMKSPTFYFR